ncbi:MAG: cobalamin B12-binding domain-containing protein [Desulfosalsimonas sp.]
MSEELMYDLEDLPEIPERTSQLYKNSLGQLVERVNSLMASRPDITLLTGGSPASVMFDNHKNHALFMSAVFSLDAWCLLARVLPWVYRAYKGRGFDYAYFPAHLQAWRTALYELLPPPDAEPLIHVYEWIESRHEKIIRLSGENVLEAPEPEPRWEETCGDFLKALLSADSRACAQLAADSVDSAADLAGFYLNVIQPSMYEVGRKWEEGEISVAAEHLASALVNRVMSMHYLELIKEPPKIKGRAAVTASANEFHEIGATMVANVLEADGWEVEYLGANTPMDDFPDFVASGGFDIVLISVTMSFNLESVKEAILRIREISDTDSPPVLVGGLLFNQCPEMSEKIGASGYAADCRQAAVLADKWKQKKKSA